MYQTEELYEGENKIISFEVWLPDKIGDYDTKDCNIELRCYIQEGYISYTINSSEKTSYLKVTTDITEKAGLVKLMFVITHEGNVIGKTNKETIEVHAAPSTAEPPLTPRAQFDERIQELEGQVTTLTAQNETLTRQNSEKENTISGLNSQVSELTAENQKKAQTITRQNTTIDQLNSRVPAMETPDPVNPSTIQQTVRPDPEGSAVGLTAVTINPVTSNIDQNIQPDNIKGGVSILGVQGTLNIDLQKFLARGIDFDLEIESDTIGDYLCYKQTGMTSCRLTGHPTSIGQYAFYGCTALQGINIPDSVTSLDGFAFTDCNSLQEINLPNSLTSIGQRTFRNCNSLVGKLTIPENLGSIGEAAFSGTSSITEIIFPDTLSNTFTGAQREIFMGCGATKVKLPSEMVAIPSGMFYGCLRLATIHLPSSLTSVANNAFFACGSLFNVTLGNDFNCTLNISYSALYSHDTILSWFNALADRTGQIAYTLTIGATNIAKMTAEEIAIATSKNWNIA